MLSLLHLGEGMVFLTLSWENASDGKGLRAAAGHLANYGHPGQWS